MSKQIRDVVTHTPPASSRGKRTTEEKDQEKEPLSFADRRKERSNDAFLKKMQNKRNGGSSSGNGSGGGHKRSKSWGAAIVFLALIAFGVYAFFPSVTVRFTPRQENIVLSDTSFTAEKGAADGLSFEFIEIRASEQETIPARGTEQVDQKASGRITIYNEHSTSDQRFVRNTRFESPDGLIYRINESVVIPGMEEVDGEMVPGQVTITVYADIPGEEYNIGESGISLTIPGLRGSPSFDEIYARSVEPITGGFSGERKTASPEDLERAQERLNGVLRDALLADARSQLPQDFILFDDAIIISFEDEVDDTSSSNNSVNVQRTGILHGIIFHKNDLARAIAEQEVADHDNGEVEVRSWEGIVFEHDGEAPEDIIATDEITFLLNGSVEVTWLVDRNEVERSLAGIPKNEFEAVLDRYDHVIERAEAIIRPRWKRSFPTDPEKIRLVEEGEEE